jgi:hypothetical protein
MQLSLSLYIMLVPFEATGYYISHAILSDCMKTVHDNLVFVNSVRRYQSFPNSLMAATKTIHVPHLGGIEAGYALSNDSYDGSKPTCVLINSMCTTVMLYRDQFSDKSLTDAMNLLAIEPLGHGATSCSCEHFTYWDTAIMVLQIMDVLGIHEVFALGTSQGGWMVVWLALLAPERVCVRGRSRKRNSISPH